MDFYSLTLSSVTIDRLTIINDHNFLKLCESTYVVVS
jgi:hypothetical protein